MDRRHLTETGATYDAIEGRFRLIKKEATRLRDQIDSGERPVAPARNGSSTSSSNSPTKKSTNGRSSAAGPNSPSGSARVINGRVGKSSGNGTKSPSKRGKQSAAAAAVSRNNSIKAERYGLSSFDGSTDDHIDMENMSAAVDDMASFLTDGSGFGGAGHFSGVNGEMNEDESFLGADTVGHHHSGETIEQLYGMEAV